MRNMVPAINRLRTALHQQINPMAWPHRGLSPLNLFIVLCILCAALLAIAETEPTVREWTGFATLMSLSDLFFASVFTTELLMRFWIIGENPEFRGISGRLRYLMRPATLIDIAALVPFYITLGNNSAFVLRLFRFMRILTLAKLGRYSEALKLLLKALGERRYELFISLAFAAIALLVSATCLYAIEGDGQPEAFGSIPRALWWSVATLTTVGYGDVYPLTVLGRLFGGLTALTGIAIIAMPTGIIAAAFSDALQQRRKNPPPVK